MSAIDYDLAPLAGKPGHACIVALTGRGPGRCAVLAFPACPRPTVVRMDVGGVGFEVCAWHQARVICRRRRWTTTTVTPAPRDPATIVDGSTRRVVVPAIGAP